MTTASRRSNASQRGRRIMPSAIARSSCDDGRTSGSRDLKYRAHNDQRQHRYSKFQIRSFCDREDVADGISSDRYWSHLSREIAAMPSASTAWCIRPVVESSEIVYPAAKSGRMPAAATVAECGGQNVCCETPTQNTTPNKAGLRQRFADI